MIILFMCAVTLLPARQMVSYPLGPPFDKRNKVKYDTEELKDFTLCITHLPKVGAKNLFHYSSTKSLIFKWILHHEVNLPNSLIEAQVTTFYLLLPLTFRNGIQHFLPMNNQKFEMQILKDLPYNQFHVLCGYRPGYICLLLYALTFELVNEPTFEKFHFLTATVDFWDYEFNTVVQAQVNTQENDVFAFYLKCYIAFKNSYSPNIWCSEHPIIFLGEILCSTKLCKAGLTLRSQKFQHTTKHMSKEALHVTPQISAHHVFDTDQNKKRLTGHLCCNYKAVLILFLFSTPSYLKLMFVHQLLGGLFVLPYCPLTSTHKDTLKFNKKPESETEYFWNVDAESMYNNISSSGKVVYSTIMEKFVGLPKHFFHVVALEETVANIFSLQRKRMLLPTGYLIFCVFRHTFASLTGLGSVLRAVLTISVFAISTCAGIKRSMIYDTSLQREYIEAVNRFSQNIAELFMLSGAILELLIG